jgi:hypothetical protein
MNAKKRPSHGTARCWRGFGGPVFILALRGEQFLKRPNTFRYTRFYCRSTADR